MASAAPGSGRKGGVPLFHSCLWRTLWLRVEGEAPVRAAPALELLGALPRRHRVVERHAEAATEALVVGGRALEHRVAALVERERLAEGPKMVVRTGGPRVEVGGEHEVADGNPHPAGGDLVRADLHWVADLARPQASITVE